jgi:hypothetical protein
MKWRTQCYGSSILHNVDHHANSLRRDRHATSGGARKRPIVEAPALIVTDSDTSVSSEEYREDSSSSLSWPESLDNDEGEEGGSPMAMRDLEDDFDALYFNEPIIPDAEYDDYAVHPEPSDELMIALESISLSSLQMQKARQLPFRLQQLRRGFEHRCRLVGVPTDGEHEKRISVFVVYKYEVKNDEGTPPIAHEYQTQLDAWVCPLCELHGSLKTREMLAKHLEWDHFEVSCSWEEVGRVRYLLACFDFFSLITVY